MDGLKMDSYLEGITNYRAKAQSLFPYLNLSHLDDDGHPSVEEESTEQAEITGSAKVIEVTNLVLIIVDAVEETILPLKA